MEFSGSFTLSPGVQEGSAGVQKASGGTLLILALTGLPEGMGLQDSLQCPCGTQESLRVP